MQEDSVSIRIGVDITERSALKYNQDFWLNGWDILQWTAYLKQNNYISKGKQINVDWIIKIDVWASLFHEVEHIFPHFNRRANNCLLQKADNLATIWWSSLYFLWIELRKKGYCRLKASYINNSIGNTTGAIPNGELLLQWVK